MAQERDIFRDTWVRYLGYANEVGESFRPVVPRRVVHYSYAAAFAYVFADTADKTYKMAKKDSRARSVALASGDALIWQTFASVLIPGYTINRISAFAHRNLSCCRLPSMVVKGLTVAVGLASIPIIVAPIDAAVTFVMDQTYRRWCKT